MSAVAGSLGCNADLLGVPERRRVIVAGACSAIQDAVRADERGPRADALRQMRRFAGVARRRRNAPALKLDIGGSLERSREEVVFIDGLCRREGGKIWARARSIEPVIAKAVA